MPMAVFIGIVVSRSRHSGSGYESWFYPCVLLTLGASAVMARNWGNRRGLLESLKAAVYGLVVLFKVLGVTLFPIAVARAADWNPIGMVVLLVVYSPMLLLGAAFWLAVCAGVACAGGAGCYGFLLLTDLLGRRGTADSKDLRPRPLRMLDNGGRRKPSK